MLLDKRQAGVILHPTSLPGSHGIGDLGGELLKFLDWMKECGLGIWQVLPLGPTGFGDSPYQCFSAFAGNPYLISPDQLVEDGLLTVQDLKHGRFPSTKVDFGPVIEWKMGVLRKAWENFRKSRSRALTNDFERFRSLPEVAPWLERYALFAALKAAHKGAPWNMWEKDLRAAKPAALEAARERLASEVGFQVFCQFLFYNQWSSVRAAARSRGITIMGDAPIYVAYDSADTWGNQELFQLRPDGTPTHVAGVPPDYFSKTGQLWGNPLYRWERMRRDGFGWWVERLRSMLNQVDIVRLDHFRGFAGYWSVPFGETTAINGRWERGPGEHLFAAVRRSLGHLPIVAEDLGVITDDVVALRHGFQLPGMKVLQFGWGVSRMKPLTPDPGNDHQFHRIERSSVVYTGTHDNPTAIGWWEEFATPGEKALLKVAAGSDGTRPHEDLMRLGFLSCANTVMVPLQDFLGLGSDARMNFPGKASGNWSWRMKPGATSAALARRIRAQLTAHSRVGC